MMKTIPKFPKIFHLGHRHTKTIFDGSVEITEKVDGSQFSFGRINEQLICRSKRTILDLSEPDNLFKPAVEYALRLYRAGLLPPEVMYFSETLMREKHNVLKYDRVPKNHIALFAMYDIARDEWADHRVLTSEAMALDIDVVPLILFSDTLKWPDDVVLGAMLDVDSFLGGPKVEGIVFKNYEHDFMVGDQYFPIQCAKYVSEKFKEKHDQNAYGRKKSKMSWDDFIKSFQTEARWMKAVQHLRDDGKLLREPKDIGPLIKEVQQDILEEDLDEIKEFLWKTFGKELIRVSTHGLPEWYKQKLATGEIE